MLRLKIDVRNERQVLQRIRSLGPEVQRQLQEALDDSGNSLRDAVVTNILHGEKTGETYQKYDPRRTHVASAAGEAPASDSGYLVGHIVKDTSELPDLSIAVVSLAPYSEALEYGTRKMAPRPFMRPALHQLSNFIRARLGSALAAATRRSR